MNMRDFSFGGIVAAGIIAFWILIDGRLIYPIVNLLIAGEVPGTSIIISPSAMLNIWMGLGILLIFTLTYRPIFNHTKRMIVYIKTKRPAQVKPKHRLS